MVATSGRGMATGSSQMVAKTRGFKILFFFFFKSVRDGTLLLSVSYR